MKKTCISLALASLIIGCGGGGGSDKTSKYVEKNPDSKKHTMYRSVNARLIDAPIQGVRYVIKGGSSNGQGVTGIGGTFPYKSGTVTFYIGNIKLGIVSSINKLDKLVFLQDILGLERSDVENSKLVELATFIQSIDEDKSTNDIEINGDKFISKDHIIDLTKYLKQDTIVADLRQVAKDAGYTLKNEDLVKEHLKDSYEGIDQDKSLARVIDSTPNNNQVDVDVNTDIKLIFSKLMPKDAFSNKNITLKDSKGEFIEITITRADKTILRIRPNNSLKDNETYTLSLDGVTDYRNKKLSSDPLVFTTGVADDSDKDIALKGDIVFKGFAYNEITSPITNKVWLDRNLGARTVCKTKDEESCYGDYYQWGRRANGHEKKDSDVIDVSRRFGMEKGEGGIKEDVDTDGKFATWGTQTVAGRGADWRHERDDTLWQGVEGKNNPCPPNYRIPTLGEVTAETKGVDKLKFPDQVLDGQYSNLTNFLKLPNNGYRKYATRDGIIEGTGYSGAIWTSTVTDTGSSYKFDFFPGGAWGSIVSRAFGLGVRCIKGDTTSEGEEKKATKPFKVLSTYPAQGDKDIGVNPKFTITFSNPINPTLFNPSPSLRRDDFTIRRVSDGKEAGIAALPSIIDRFTVTFTLNRSNEDASGGLEHESKYELIIHPSIKDLSNQGLSEDYKITFETE